MSDAFRCDRCGEYSTGSGVKARVGEYVKTSGFKSIYDFFTKAELCKSCFEGLEHVVEEYMDTEVERND